EEALLLSQWFDLQWSSLVTDEKAKSELVETLQAYSVHQAPYLVYTLILHHLFSASGEDFDEDRIVKSATGIRNTVVWRKLYKFQRDGVVGAIDKLNRFGGCIIADSVGLGKTFEALAIIKYHELRNDRVLVLCPKRLRDNWTLYKANDRRNFLASDRFNYDVLNHTDLSRDGGLSGDIDLSHVNWGNYDLVVIDESHNFRNKKTPRQGSETRYDRLMRRIIREGVRTRVLMLSATPVNNRMADLRNQIAFATEGNDSALLDHGIGSIDSTTRLAQKQFNRWLDLEESERTPTRLIEMLGFDYFTLLDLLTIARSRKHVEKYYGTSETGKFPERLKPINIKADVDLTGQFRSIRD
ncbi:MAG: DEAD/DEAH box helicase, partial [Desulfobulbus sp.]|nr:DEAD/DEAH box helicase [Desulfobulbus sp.]